MKPQRSREAIDAALATAAQRRFDLVPEDSHAPTRMFDEDGDKTNDPERLCHTDPMVAELLDPPSDKKELQEDRLRRQRQAKLNCGLCAARILCLSETVRAESLPLGHREIRIYGDVRGGTTQADRRLIRSRNLR